MVLIAALLHGIPIAHKDLMRTKGVCARRPGLKIFRRHYVPGHDAVIVSQTARGRHGFTR